jgi:hypothetical protein
MIDAAREIIRNEGVGEFVKRGTGYAWQTALSTAFGLTPQQGENVYEREWDVLLVLDACRYDLMDDVASTRAWLGPVEATTSVGSMSKTWLDRTFDSAYADQAERTVMVSGNPYTAESLTADSFSHLDETWRESWDDSTGTIRPRPLTDRFLELHASTDADRYIVHYMQPHIPFIETPLGAGTDRDSWGELDTSKTAWERLQVGELSRDRVWKAYRENLELVLADVALLRQQLSTDGLVLTADHGNALGEWGVYGHPEGIQIPAIREVPWVPVETDGPGSYEPSPLETAERSAPARDEQLAALGYS